ncbi:MAG: cupin domain-containing protein [Dehalococcoidia bacterium]|nr:cupin domain-containing protein [Dehalococcoidia bacterium]
MFRTNPEANAVEMFPGVVRRTLNSGERTTLVEITLDEGSTVPAHTHPHEQAGYVSTGRVRFRIDDEERELGPGDSYLVPSQAEHEVTALERSVCIDIFSPVREEYL